MGRTTELRRELKKIFVPFMTSKGFVLDQRNAPFFLGFRRAIEGRVQFFEIMWEKYGAPRFVVDFGDVSPSGVICHGKHVPADDVGPGQAPEYCRLLPGRSADSTRHWLRQDRPMFSALLAWSTHYPASEPVQQLINLFGEAEAYWATGVMGPHCRKIVNKWSHDGQLPNKPVHLTAASGRR